MHQLLRCLLVVGALCIVGTAGENPADQAPRVYLTDRDTWGHFGFVGAGGNVVAGASRGGVHRTHVEQVKTLNKSCPELKITMNPRNADYAVVWDSKSWMATSWSGHMNEFVVYNRAGDLVSSGGTQRISAAAKTICKSLTGDWKAFRLDGHEYTVEEVLDQWYGPEHVFFKVRADDGNVYILRHETSRPGGDWELMSFRETRR